jgi:CubicO group peptidase (beta-lactamase class C family)
LIKKEEKIMTSLYSLPGMKPYQIMMRLGQAIALIILALMLGRSSVAAQASPAAVNTPDFAAIEAYVEQRMRDLRIPGLALVVAQGDRIIDGQGFGVTGPDGRAVTPQTPFQIASLTKPMTGVAVMQLVEAGKIELDAPAQRYIPWFRVADEAASAQITVRHLLYHTSGLPEAVGVEYYLPGDARPNALEERVRALSTVQLNRPVGSDYQYANMGYSILGLLIQEVSGQSYEAYIQTHLFTPLQMHQTFTDWTVARANGAASGHRYWFGVPVAGELAVDRAGLPAAGVTASAEDVAHFLIAQLNDGQFGDTKILSAAGIAEMQRPIAPLNPDEYYAMDWSVGQIGGERIIFKGGSLADFKSQMVLIPDRRMGLVVLMNANKQFHVGLGDMRLPLLPYNVVELLLGQPATDFPASPIPALLYTALFLIVAVQVAGILRTAGRLESWCNRPEQSPVGRQGLVTHLVLPLLTNLGWGLLALLWPRLFDAPLSYLIYAAPDLGLICLISGVVALAWGIVRTISLLWLLRAVDSPTSTAPARPVRA